MKIEEKIKRCEELIKPEHSGWIGISNQLAIGAILNELDNKDKVIDMMAKYIRAGDIDEDICITETECISENLQCENCIKEYFNNKVRRIVNEN